MIVNYYINLFNDIFFKFGYEKIIMQISNFHNINETLKSFLSILINMNYNKNKSIFYIAETLQYIFRHNHLNTKIKQIFSILLIETDIIRIPSVKFNIHVIS